MADLAPETDLDKVADVAYTIAEKVRDESPVSVRRELVAFCEQHPMKAAQVLMVLGVWFDPDITTAELWDRVDSVTRLPVGERAADEAALLRVAS